MIAGLHFQSRAKQYRIKKMNLGFFMMPVHPPEKDRTLCFDEDLEFIERADALGFTEGWVGHHESLAWEPIAASDVFLSAALQRTKKIRLGTGVVIMPQTHPARVASSIAMLDHLSHGRVNFGFGQGGVPTDWELYNLPDGKTQGLMTVEALDMVLKIWSSNPPFECNGRFWNVKIQGQNPDIEMGQMVKPFQKPHPPIATSIIKPKSMGATMAGERGYIPISSNLVPSNTVVEHWKTYCEGARSAGKPEPDRSIWRVSRNIFIGETDKQAWDFANNSVFWPFVRLPDQTDQPVENDRRDEARSKHAGWGVTREYALNELCIIGDVTRSRAS